MLTTTFLRFITVLVLIYVTILTFRCADNATEIRALLSFKQNLEDPFGVMDGWNLSTPLAPFDWSGIGYFQGQVLEIRLSRIQLSGRLTDQLSNLRQLRRLSLHSNNLNGSIPLALSECVLLRAVYLQYNSLFDGLPPAMSNLTNLQDLSSNSFFGSIPTNFSAFTQLQLICLSTNSLARFRPRLATSLGCSYLWLDTNELYDTSPSAILTARA